MAYTQQDLDTLRAAMASGVLRTKFRDQEVQYRSLDEMKQLERDMVKVLGTAPTARVYPTYGSGL